MNASDPQPAAAFDPIVSMIIGAQGERITNAPLSEIIRRIKSTEWAAITEAVRQAFAKGGKDAAKPVQLSSRIKTVRRPK